MEERRSFPALTSLKGIFILIIAFHNTMLVHPLFAGVPGAAFLTSFGGSLGNSVFFVLSGLCMTWGYRDRIAAHSISFGEFLWKRLKKLYPLYFLTNLIALILDTVQYGMSAVNLEKIASTFLLKLGGGLRTEGPYNAPTWFLCTLFLCYILFFLLCYHTRTGTRYYAAIALGIILGRAISTASVGLPFCSESDGVGLMNFFVGCALAEVYPRIDQKAHRWAAPLSFAALLSSFFLFLRYGTENICGNVNAAFALFVTPLILYLALAEGLCSRILRWKPLVSLGKISGSVFFWHLVIYFGFRIVFSWIFPGQEMGEADYLLYFAIMIGWCIGSYFLLERPRRR